MNWREHIHSDADIRKGRPVVKGTRLAVDFILGLFANGWTTEQVLEGYPSLSKVHLQAVFAFAAECLQEEAVYDFPNRVKNGISG